MRPESLRFVEYAHTCLGRADTMLKVGLTEDAARAAYFACFQAAQALIFEYTEKSVKSHHGVQTEFFRLTRGDVRVDPSLRSFLSQSYEFKSAADYFTGGDASLPDPRARDALATAQRFVAHIIALLESPDR